MTRPIQAHIDLQALKHNYLYAKQCSQGKALAVVKANAYGHGAVACAQALENIADGFAVASLEEAKQLRVARIQKPILLLEGFFDSKELSELVALDCWLVIHDQWQVDQLLQFESAQVINVWLKVDTGMHRLGLSPDEACRAYQVLSNAPQVSQITLMTHFANADVMESSDTSTQVSTLQQLVQTLDYQGDVSVANSAAVIGWSDLQAQIPLNHWLRPGIMLYGSNPFYGDASSVETDDRTQPLQAVMTLTANIIAIKTIKKGEAIGYGSLFEAPNEMRIGIAACGYADGYPRTAEGAPAVVAGKTTTVIGRVSMDMLFVSLQDIPEAVVGTRVELWGKQVSVDAVAAAANTLSYELLCNVKRVEFIYD